MVASQTVGCFLRLILLLASQTGGLFFSVPQDQLIGWGRVGLNIGNTCILQARLSLCFNLPL